MEGCSIMVANPAGVSGAQGDGGGAGTGWVMQVVAVCEPFTVGDLEDLITGREGDVLSLIVAGLADVEIARQLSVAHRTIRSHVDALFGKLNVANRTQLALVGCLAHLRACGSCRVRAGL
jgi:DNA-binding CsgD family transcriptional regulator